VNLCYLFIVLALENQIGNFKVNCMTTYSHRCCYDISFRYKLVTSRNQDINNLIAIHDDLNHSAYIVLHAEGIAGVELQYLWSSYIGI